MANPTALTPSQRLTAYLSGHDLSPDAATQSWARLEIHRAAIQVLATPKEKREDFLAKIPPHIATLVRTEANRIWSWRRANS